MSIMLVREKKKRGISKLKEAWGRSSDSFQAFWSQADVHIRLNLLRSTRDMLLQRTISKVPTGPTGAEAADCARALFYAACPELSDEKISRLVSAVFPKLIAVRVLDAAGCLRHDAMFAHTAVAAALPKGSTQVATVEKDILDKRQQYMHTFLLDTISVFSRVEGSAGFSATTGRANTSAKTGKQQEAEEVMEEMEAVTEEEGGGKHGTVSDEASTTATPAASGMVVPRKHKAFLPTVSEEVQTDLDVGKPPSPPMTAKATTSEADATSKSILQTVAAAPASTPPVQMHTAAPAPDKSSVKIAISESACVIDSSTVVLGDNNMAWLSGQWRVHGQGFSVFWARLGRRKLLPDGTDADAGARFKFLRMARDSLLRRMAEGGSAKLSAGARRMQQMVFFRLCPELEDDKLSRLCQGDLLPKLMRLRVEHAVQCAQHDAAFISANVVRSAPEHVGTRVTNRQLFMHSFLADVLSLFANVQRSTTT